jgi:hypothetical protein
MTGPPRWEASSAGEAARSVERGSQDRRRDRRSRARNVMARARTAKPALRNGSWRRRDTIPGPGARRSRPGCRSARAASPCPRSGRGSVGNVAPSLPRERLRAARDRAVLPRERAPGRWIARSELGNEISRKISRIRNAGGAWRSARIFLHSLRWTLRGTASTTARPGKELVEKSPPSTARSRPCAARELDRFAQDRDSGRGIANRLPGNDDRRARGSPARPALDRCLGVQPYRASTTTESMPIAASSRRRASAWSRFSKTPTRTRFQVPSASTTVSG